MREALAALEALRDRPNEAVERSRPVKISLAFDATWSDQGSSTTGRS
jgi:hypothetical protein